MNNSGIWKTQKIYFCYACGKESRMKGDEDIQNVEEKKMVPLKEGLPPLPAKRACFEIVGFIRRFTHASRSNCVFGLSGGLDSATLAYLLVRAIKKENIHAVIMPYHQSDKSSLEDARLVIKALDIDYRIIDISPCIDRYFEQFEDVDQSRRGNKMARERMAVLYDMAALYRGLVVGTGNRSELLLGYFTKFGDGGVDVEPLGGLYKTHVYELAKYLGVPEGIIHKDPTADLWPGQRDEDELGIGYKEADRILYLMIDMGVDMEGLIKRGCNRKHVEKVGALYRYSRHKRVLPPVPDMRQIFTHL